MKKIYFFTVIIILLHMPMAFSANHRLNCGPQTKSVVITKSLIQKLNSMDRSSANASEVEKLLGPACACLTDDPSPTNEVWTCQWKNDFSSNRIQNTLNISFAAGALSKIIGIAADGTGYSAQAGEAVKIFKNH